MDPHLFDGPIDTLHLTASAPRRPRSSFSSANPNPNSVSPLYWAAYRGSELLVSTLFRFVTMIKSRSKSDPAAESLLLLLEHSPLTSSSSPQLMRMNHCSTWVLYLACMQRDLWVIRLTTGRIKQEQIGPGQTLYWEGR
jgi:hypothetical protein